MSSVGSLVAAIGDKISQMGAAAGDDMAKIAGASADDVVGTGKLVVVDFASSDGTISTAMQKTAPVATDDAAASAKQMVDGGLKANREWPVIWAIFCNSIASKTLMIPIAILLSMYMPTVVVAIMIIAGLYLSYEGVEKALEYFQEQKEDIQTVIDEKQRIWNASKIDAVLSIEIVILALGSIGAVDIKTKTIVLAVVCYSITVLIYSAVAILVKIDDFGAWVYHTTKYKELGKKIIRSAPKIMAVVGFIGTAAMFLVGGSILIHNISVLHHLQQTVISMVPSGIESIIETALSIVTSAIFGGILVSISSIFHKE